MMKYKKLMTRKSCIVILNIKICNNKLPQSVSVSMIWKDLDQIRCVVYSTYMLHCLVSYTMLGIFDEIFPDHMKYACVCVCVCVCVCIYIYILYKYYFQQYTSPPLLLAQTASW